MGRSGARLLRRLVVLLLLFAFLGSMTGCKPKQVAVLPEAEEPVVIVDEKPPEPEPPVLVPPWDDSDLVAILRQDNNDWRSYGDLGQEQEAIGEVLEHFSAAMLAKDVDAAVACVFPELQESYRVLFVGKPDAMPGFAEIISLAQMSFLSEDRDPQKTAFLRTAEYKVEVDGFAFFIRFIKTAEGWVLYDF